MRGRFVAFEGGEGCGKSTQARLLAERLGAVLTHEPGATELGRRVRTLVLGPAVGSATVDARAEALLMAADRAQHVAEVVRPALEKGLDVVTDRFSGSTLAYQGYGRGLPLDDLRWLTRWASGGLEPDAVVLIEVPVEVAMARAKVRTAWRARTGSSTAGSSPVTGPWRPPTPTAGPWSTGPATSTRWRPAWPGP